MRSSLSCTKYSHTKIVICEQGFSLEAIYQENMSTFPSAIHSIDCVEFLLNVICMYDVHAKHVTDT